MTNSSRYIRHDRVMQLQLGHGPQDLYRLVMRRVPTQVRIEARITLFVWTGPVNQCHARLMSRLGAAA